MRFLAYLRHAFKLTNLSYPYKNSLNYLHVAGSDNSTQNRCFASKSSDGEHNGDEGFQETLAVMSLLRDNSRQVELFPAENLEELKTKSQRDEGNSTEKSVINAKDTKGLEKNILHSIRSGINHKINSTKEFPNPIIDAEMTILKKSLFSPSNLMKCGNLNDSITLSLSKNARLEAYDTTTIPLQLNTLINGNSDIDDKKIPHHELQNLKVPEFNEYLTSLAANLCSAAVQSGFPSENSRKSYCTENTLDANSIQKICETKGLSTSSKVASKETKDTKRDPHIVCVRDGNKGCISPGNGKNPPYSPNKLTGKEKPQEAKGALSGLGLLDPQLYKKSLKEAEMKRKELAKTSASCKKKLSLRACQSKKSTNAPTEVKDPCRPSTSKCRSEIESVKNVESVTEPSSPFKCGSKTAKSKCGSENIVSKNSPPKLTASICRSDEAGSKVNSKTDRGSVKLSELKVSPTISQKTSKCRSEIKNTESVPKKLSNIGTESSADKKTQVENTMSPETNSKMCEKSEKVTETSKCSTKPEAEPETTLKCSSKSELKLEDPCKISPPTKSKSSCGLISGSEDPCKVPPITFNKTLDKSDSASKCSTPSKAKCAASNEEKPSTCTSIPKKNSPSFAMF